MNEHPIWATKFKTKGTELRCIRGKYYLYEVKSVWDKEKQRARKITGKCLGSISENGFKATKPKTEIDYTLNPPKVKMYGGFAYLMTEFSDWFPILKSNFPKYWQQIFCMACLRLFYKAPVKNIPFYFERSFFSETYQSMPFSEKMIGKVLHEIGSDQASIDNYMKNFIQGNHVVLIDATPIFTKSKNIYEAKLGYNNKQRWDNQINLLYLYDQNLSMPLFYRLVEGDIREIRTMEITIHSAGLNNVIIVGDKGFTSELNMEITSQTNLSYILPLKRNSSYIDYTVLHPYDESRMDGYFKYKERYIWYKTKRIDEKKRVVLFMDESLKLSERKDYLDRIEKFPDEYNLKSYHENQIKMGTLATIDNVVDSDAKSIYSTYKSRCEIEQLFDAFKNTLNADRTYMHSIESVQGWMFVNHLAISMYYKLHNLLKTNDMLEKIAVNDIIEHLQHINAVKINSKWHLQEISAKTNKLFSKIKINLPITWIEQS